MHTFFWYLCMHTSRQTFMHVHQHLDLLCLHRPNLPQRHDVFWWYHNVHSPPLPPPPKFAETHAILPHIQAKPSPTASSLSFCTMVSCLRYGQRFRIVRYAVSSRVGESRKRNDKKTFEYCCRIYSAVARWKDRNSGEDCRGSCGAYRLYPMRRGDSSGATAKYRKYARAFAAASWAPMPRTQRHPSGCWGYEKVSIQQRDSSARWSEAGRIGRTRVRSRGVVDL